MESGYTVIVPTYNRRDVVGRALRSIAQQDVPPTQVVLVNDGSEEDIAAVARDHADLPIDYVSRAERGGAAAARNTGIESARSPIVAFLDSDDEWLPAKMATQLVFLNDNPDIDLCCAGFLIRSAGAPEQTRRFDAASFATRDLAFGCGLSPGSTLCVRRPFIATAGDFDPAFPRLEDWDWLISRLHPITDRIVDVPLAVIHASGPPTEDQVRVAVGRIRRKHGRRFFGIGLRAGLRFHAALLNERAVAAFRNHGYVRAALYFVAAMATYPMREREYFVRIGRKVVDELRSRFGSS